MKKKNHKRQQNKPTNQQSGKSASHFLLLLNNLSAGIAFTALLYLAYNHYSGYQWVMQHLIRDNIAYIDQHPGLTTTQKLEVKLGFEYTFLKYIKEHSPEDAILLLPFDQQHFTNPQLKLQNFFNPHLTIMRKEHVASFIYPRKVVVLRDRLTDPNYMRATHLAIVDFHGYDLLPGYKDRNIQHGLLNIASNSNR